MSQTMTAPLTDKQAAFCIQYLIDFNASGAAERAGYSKKTAGSQGHRLLKNVEVQAHLSKLVGEKLAAAEVSADQVLGWWRDIATADIGRFLRLNEMGKVEIDEEALLKNTHIISEFTQDDVGTTPMGKKITRTRVKLHDRKVGIEALSKYFKLYADGLPDGSGDAPADPEAARTRTFETLERYIVGDDAFLEGLAAVFARHRRRLDQLNLLAKGK